MRILKNKKNYILVFFNINDRILLLLNINYKLYFEKHNNAIFVCMHAIKSYLKENGIKFLLFENLYKFGIKFNILINLLNNIKNE
jgi:hypothetical protein